MFTLKKLASLTITALCLLAWTLPASSQSGADVPPQVLHRPHDVARLPDGHTLITDGGQPPGGSAGAQPGSSSKIIEVDADGNVVWFFPSIRLRLLRAGDQGLSWAHNADRLPNGNTLISDTGYDRVIEIDASGTIVWDSDDVSLSDGSALDYPNDANWLPDDHLLITDRDNHRVIEIARDGAIVWQFGETGVPGNDDVHLGGPHNADRLSSGNTIVADSLNDRIIEVAPDGSIVWQYPPPHDGRRSPTEPPSLRSETFGDQESSSAPPLLDWPRDADRLSNGNTLITDSRHNRIIEVTPSGQVAWHYDNLELPYDADRLSNGNTLISGSPSGGVVEVDFAGAIVWQYPPVPTGAIAGTVQDSGAQPVSGATVTVFGTSLSDTTDADGQYAISDVPVAAPRYIVTASTPPQSPPQAGGMTGGEAQAGDVDVTEGMTTTVDFTLEAGTQVTETLHAMIGYIVYRDPSSELLIPPATAVLSPTLYPAEVLPYLQSGQYIESDNPAIAAVAQSILDGLTSEEQTEQTTVAHAVYVWMVQNIAYDLTKNYPGDVTSGNWQTTYGAWGHSFADWLYTAEELLEEGRGICIEHARLATALLRAVGIPARPAPLMAHPVTQWWVQLPDGSGFWANMDTSKGRSEYVDSGDLWADFPSKEEHNLGFWAIDADAPIHMDWWTDNPCIWTEDYGGGRQYLATADGLAQAQAGLDYFAQTGELPAPAKTLRVLETLRVSIEPYYQLSLRGFEVDLTSAGEQTQFEVSFALAIETDYLERIDQIHWTNHPDWVTDAYTTTQSSAETGESLTWYVLELDRQQEQTDEGSPFGFHPAGVFKPGYPDNGYTDATNIGVKWAREGVYAFWFLVQPDLNQQVYDFSLYDQQYGSIPTDLNILANIAPQGPIDEGRCLPGYWLPVDEAQYTAFVTATVERYDGDGVDDMPGLVNPIEHWQVGNEPNDQARSDFAELQHITYQAIKQACPDCMVLIGGVAGGPENYVANFDVRYAPILAELAGQYVDVFDFHWYGTADGEYRLQDTATGEDALEHIRATLTANGFATDLPLWITEMGSYSGDPASHFPFQTERQQALDYFKRFIYSLSRGVQKVFPAFGLMEGFKHDDGYFDHTGLIYDGAGSDDLGLGVKKLSYYTYKKMTEKLEGADWSTLTTLHDGTGGDHLYLFRVVKDGQSIHIAWWDYFDEPGYTPGDTKPITLTGLTSPAITVTTVVPAADTGQEVTDYATAFTVTTYPVSDGSATIVLGEDPVLVEGGEQPPPSILASIVMHNEEPRSGLYPDFVNDEAAFWQHRAALVQFVDMLHDNGVMFNYQSDWNFLMAAGMYDTGAPETDGKNIVRYIKDLGFEVDPHAHESQYNYADVAYLIEALGVSTSHTAGGFIADPPQDSKLEYLWQPLTATLSPTYTWQAEILWGGATSRHQDEESVWASGVWKPKDNEHFMEHGDAAPLPHVGGYGRKCDPLVKKQQSGELEEDKIHTCTIFVSQNNLLLPGYIQSFEQQIQALDAAGDVRWMGLAEVINLWQTEYDSEPNIVPYTTPTPTPTPTLTPTPQPRIYLPLILKSYHPLLVTPTPTPTPEPVACDPITLVDNSQYYEGSDDECWHKEDLPSPQPWFEETIPPDPSTTLRASSGLTTTPLYFGISVHIEPKPEYMDDVTYQQDRERLRRLAEIVAEHGGVLTIQTQTPFDDKAQQLGDTIFADLAAQGHEIALHFHEDAHITDADNQPVEEWVTVLGEEIDLIEALSGAEVRTWSGGNVYDHLYEAAEQVGLEVNMNYKNPQTQQSDERYTILTPWRPSGGASVEERTTHDPDGAVIYIPSGVFPAHCDKLEAFPRPYCYEAFDYVTVALRNSLDAVTEGQVNAFYGTLHPSDFFGPGSDEEKLQIWDQWLTAVVDPLVADGRIQWATMSDIADAFVAWEESCGGATS